MEQKNDDFSLKFGYWLATHRDQLRTWWVSAILVATAASITYFFIVFVTFSFSTSKTVLGIRLMAEPLVSQSLHKAITPTPLVVGDVTAIPRGNGRYDLVAKVSNLNTHWAAVSATFHFSVGSSVTKDERTTLWPASESYLMQTNVAFESPPTGGAYSVVFTGISWRRAKDLGIYQTVSFPVSGVSIRPVTGLASGATATRLSATIENKSAYSFRSVRFIVVAKTGTSVVAVNDVIVEKFKPLEQRPVEVTWLWSVPVSSDAVIVPVLDLQDPQSFL